MEYLFARDISAAAQTATELVAAPGAARKIVVLGVFFSADADIDLTLDGGLADPWTQYAAARGGHIGTPGSQPWFECDTNTALDYTTVGAGNSFVSVTYVEVDA